MKKRFDAVAWMRQRRTYIDEEDAALSWAQKRQRTHEQALRDPLLALLCAETIAPEKVGSKTRKRLTSSDRHSQPRARRS